MSTTTATTATLNDLVYRQPISHEISCKYKLPCGWCEKRDCMCTYSPNVTLLNTTDPYNFKLEDFTTPVIHELEKTLGNDNIPAACKGCPNHPSNGGSGVCHCILGSLNQITCSADNNINNKITPGFNTNSSIDGTVTI